MKELISFYFDIIERPDLFCNKDKFIGFLKNGRLIKHDSTELIKAYINEKDAGNTILINDFVNLLYEIFPP